MSKKSFHVSTVTRIARPRSKRMRESGVGTVSIINNGSSSGSISTCDGHSHTNKTALDAITIDDQDYIHITQFRPGTSVSTKEKSKSGYADLAARAKLADEADHAKTADHADEADRADEADNADKWDGHHFDDYLDQPVRSTDKVTFDRVTMNGFQTPDFVSGIAGVGGRMDSKGAAELDSLTLRRFLDVPELRYNRVDVTMGDKWCAPCAGIIKTVWPADQIIELKLEDGELGSVKAGDICMGIFHSQTPGQNADADFDDSRGNRRFAGFATTYFRIVEVLDAPCSKFRYQLRPTSAAYPTQVAPCPAMTFVGFGSFTDPARRTSRYETRTYQRYLHQVADWEFTASNIAAQFGDLSNLSVHGLEMTGYSAYLNNIYMQGALRSLDNTFVIDSRTKSLLMALPESGMGLAFNPKNGLTLGKVYDIQTGHFDKEYDIDLIDSTAAKALLGVSAVTKQLTDWASDSMISPTEKTALKQQRSDMQSEYAEVLTNAGKYSVSTKNYTDAYAAAITAFAKYTATTPESVLIEADYANIAAYYPARQIMLEQIATAAKAYSEKLVEEVQIGGVNLLSRHLAFIGSGDFPYLADIPVKPNCTYTYQGFGGLNVYLVIFNSGRKQYNVSQQYATFTTTEKETSVILFFDRTAMNPKPNNLALRVKLEQGNKATDWSPAPEDVQTDISYGKIYLRGAGANRGVVPIIMINGVSILSNYKRGMTLAVLNRLTMETVKVATYDTYGTVDAQKELAAQMAQYDDRNLVILVSFDAIGISTPELKAQITRCGGTQVHFVSIRMPYALLGIPGIGEGNGLEVYTSSAIDAPYAEISTQVINGTPQGIASLSARTANAAKASADAANATIAAMNNDGIFDLAEKQSIRTRWENISGISNTVYDPIPTNGGSYIRIITFAAALSVPTDGLVAAFTGLRTYLHNLDLYTGVNTPDFNRSEMAAKFTTYYDAETALANLVIKQQSLSQGDRDKNEMAQRLGYASYADMVANPTIIDGGYVRAEVIKTEQLIARNLRTGLSGNRVEIIGDDKEIKVFDDAENMCVRVSGSRSSDFVPAANNVYKLLTQKATDSSSGSRIVYAEQDDSNGKQWILFGDTSTRVCQFNKYKNSIVNIPSFTGSLNIHNYLREDINKVSGDHPIEPILNDLTTIINVKILLFHIDAQGSRTLHTTLKDYIYNSTTETPQRPIIPTKAIDTLVGEDGAYEIVLNISRSIVLTNAQSHPQTRIYWNMDAEVLPFYLTTTLDTGPSTSLFSNGLTSWWGADKYFGVLNIPGGDFMRAVCGTSGFKLNADGVQLMAKGAYNNVANNYIRSTDGLMIQWGRSRMLGAPGVVVYFPTAFATTVGLTIMGQILSGATEDQSSFAMRVHPNSIYTTRFTAFGTNVTSDVENWLYSDFMWFAIGRWR